MNTLCVPARLALAVMLLGGSAAAQFVSFELDLRVVSDAHSAPVTLTVETVGVFTSVELEYAGGAGGVLALTEVAPSSGEGQIPAADLLAAHVPGDLHTVVGFLRTTPAFALSFQAWMSDATAPSKFGATNGLAATTP